MRDENTRQVRTEGGGACMGRAVLLLLVIVDDRGAHGGKKSSTRSININSTSRARCTINNYLEPIHRALQVSTVRWQTKQCDFGQGGTVVPGSIVHRVHQQKLGRPNRNKQLST